MKVGNGRVVGLGIVALAVLGSSIYVIAGTNGQPGTYGPYECASSCSLGTPVADAGTAAYIAQVDNEQNGGTFFNPMRNTRVAGDKFVVCAPAACVTYTRTDSGHFLGGGAVPRTNGGGGGSYTPPGVGGNPGSGGIGGCSVCDPNIDDDRWGVIGDMENALDP